MTQTAVSAQKSTIGRLFRAPWPIRAAYRTLDTLAPALAARWGERIWMTLPRPRPPRPPAPHGPGQRFVITVGHNVVGSGGHNAVGSGGPGHDAVGSGGPGHDAVGSGGPGHDVVGEVWGDGPPIYLLHGWAGHRGQFADWVTPLVARGRRVVTFDAPSHGDSAPGAFGPRSTSFVEFTEALQAVAHRFGRPAAIVAHSGGAIGAAGALCDGLPADRVILLAPMSGVRSHLREFATVMGFGQRTLSRLEQRIARRVGAPLHHFDVPELGRAVAMPPTLVIHDRDDRSTPVSDGAAIAATWPGARLKVTTGLGHNRLLRSPEVIADAVDFLTA